MATTSAQPGSNVPKAPTVIDPDAPTIPENLGNLFLSPTARYELSATAWYVRWNGCSAYIGTSDGRKQSALKGMAIIERLLMAKGKSMTTTQLRGSDESLYLFGKSTWGRACQEFGLDGGTSPSETSGFQVASLVPHQAYNTRDLQRQLTLAIELIRVKLPLLADHLTQRISTPLESDRTWRYADDERQWTFGFVWQYDGSNVVVWNHDGSGKTWKIRFGEHECIVGESDGMWLLSALLRHPGEELNVDQIWDEAGISPRSAHSDLDDTKLLRGRHQLSDFQELFNEFAQELDFAPTTLMAHRSTPGANIP
jgi:hypothetical protein